MIDIEVTFLAGKRQKAIFNGFEVLSDSPESGGGEGSSPEPMDYFVASIAFCSGHYLREFCSTRNIDYKETKIHVNMSAVPDSDQKSFNISISLPKEFPQKYMKALEATVNKCTVKKTIQGNPTFDYNISI